MGLKDKLPSMSEGECLRLLATDGMLVKRPLLVDEYSAMVGFNPTAWEKEMLELERLQELKEMADKSPYKVRAVETIGGKVAVQKGEIPLFNSAEFVLGYANHIKRVLGCRKIAVDKIMFEEKFFDLSSGLIEETVQKLVGSGFTFAIFGDFSEYEGKPLYDFICESNKNGHLYFAIDDIEELKKLGDC